MGGGDRWEVEAVAKISCRRRLPRVGARSFVVSGSRCGDGGVEDGHARMLAFGVGVVGCRIEEVRTVG